MCNETRILHWVGNNVPASKDMVNNQSNGSAIHTRMLQLHIPDPIRYN